MDESALPYVDLARQHAALKGDLLAAIGQVLDHAQFVLGEEVAEFERRFAALCGVEHAIGVNSGTDALVLALSALEVGPGDEVVTVPNSFVATTAAIRLLGARPVFVDVRDDLNLDPTQLEAALTPQTKAILPVHLTGRPCEMDAILAVARRHGVAVVEDCAQAVGAEYRGRRVGSFGALGCFSLHPLKNLNACGDGGVITTDDPTLAARLRNLRDLGRVGRDDCEAWAGNSRLDTIQAAILLVKLDHLDHWTARRREIAAHYRLRLGDLSPLRLPEERPGERAVYHTFVVEARRRDELRAFLAARGVGSAVHYPLPIHLTTAGRELGYPPGSFPVAERQAARILSLPIYPELTPAEIGRVCTGIRAFYEGEA
jgi:dTDP-4-amino-4,6-dideoxygalactose transaminase